jgi:hypothetical protein
MQARLCRDYSEVNNRQSSLRDQLWRRSSHAFHQNQDTEAFLSLLSEMKKRHLVTVFGLLLNARITFTLFRNGVVLIR